MCCLIPWIKEKLDPDSPWMLVVTEIIRWLVIVGNIYLAIWRYSAIKGYTIFIPGVDVAAQFWGIVTAIFIGACLLIYLPPKAWCASRAWYWKEVRHRYGWRPSIVMYLVICAFPCSVLLCLAVKDETGKMDELSMLGIQATVLGLTVTEWMAKIREEEMSYDLISAMSVDFFFAYDVLDFYMMMSHEEKVFESYWLYIIFAAGYVAMFKYVPNQPTSAPNNKLDPPGTVPCILAGMFLNDIPFVIIRITTMSMYGLRVSDLIHPVKNLALIFFDLTQLYFIYRNRKMMKKKKVPEFSVRRVNRPCSLHMDEADRNKGGGGVELNDCECTMEEVEDEPDAESTEVQPNGIARDNNAYQEDSPKPNSLKFI